jgi:hypothetical protein
MDLGTPPKIGGETLFSLIENVIQNKRAKISPARLNDFSHSGRPPGSGEFIPVYREVSSFEVRKG